MSGIATEFLFTISLDVPVLALGDTPYGGRRIARFAGGSFEGPKLRGAVLPGGGGWMVLRRDGVLDIEVRIVLELLTELHAKNVDLYLHQQGLDTSTPSGRAMFQMMGVFAEFERAMIRERVMAGLARARQAGTHLGRKFTEDTQDGNRKVKAALAMRAKGCGYRKIAREVGLGVGTVMRLTASQEISRPFDGASVAVA